MPRSVKFGVVITLLLLVFAELASLVAIKFLAARGYVIPPLTLDQTDFEKYLAERDPVVGWPSLPGRKSNRFDAVGARRSPAFPDGGTDACVSAFGDSFTHGDQVGPAETYPNRLAVRLDCPVNNFGIGGYGTDQALLAFRARNNGETVVVLGYYSDNITRNVNRYRLFIGRGSETALKPRFLLNDGQLQLLPLPNPSSIAELASLDAETLPHDYFAPGGSSGSVRVGFPNLVTVARLFGNWRFRSKLKNGLDFPVYGDFYRRDHPAGGLALTKALMTAFWNEAKERGQKPVILLMPDWMDVELVKKGKPLPYQPLIDALAESRIDVPDLAGSMRDREICDLYINCREHFTPLGYDLVARIVQEWIVSNGLLGSD